MAENRVVLVDCDAASRKNIKAILSRAGYWVIGEAGDGLSALKLVRSRQPDMIIVAAELPAMDGLEVARIVHEDKLAPVIVLAGAQSPGLLEKAKDARVAALLIKPVDEISLLPAIEIALANYQEIISLEKQIKELKEALEKAKDARVAALLIKPVDEISLLPAIEIALANYQEIISLEKQIKELKEALETRKLVERAKGILMETLGLSEAEAFRRMQKQSMNKRISMRQVAEAIILAQSLQT